MGTAWRPAPGDWRTITPWSERARFCKLATRKISYTFKLANRDKVATLNKQNMYLNSSFGKMRSEVLKSM